VVVVIEVVKYNLIIFFKNFINYNPMANMDALYPGQLAA
jgi:hypothetical protein